MVRNRRMQRLALAVETTTRRKSLIKFFQPVQLFYTHNALNEAVIRIYDEAGNVIETHEQTVEFNEW